MSEEPTYLVQLLRDDTPGLGRKYSVPLVYANDGDFLYLFNPLTRLFHKDNSGASNDFLFGDSEFFSHGENLWFAVSEDEARDYAAMERADDLTNAAKALYRRYAQNPVLSTAASMPPDLRCKEFAVRPPALGIS